MSKHYTLGKDRVPKCSRFRKKGVGWYLIKAKVGLLKNKTS